jgi:hypothetical protein
LWFNALQLFSQHQCSSSLRFLLKPVIARRIPENAISNVDLIVVWPVFGRGAIGTIPSLIEITSPVPVSGAGANGTSGLSMVTVTPGPLEAAASAWASAVSTAATAASAAAIVVKVSGKDSVSAVACC